MDRIAVMLLLSCAVTTFAAENTGEEAAIAAILEAAGSVLRDEKLPGRPVVKVELTGCQISSAGFEKLRFLTSLQYLDL